jgi:hypothetical protein
MQNKLFLRDESRGVKQIPISAGKMLCQAVGFSTQNVAEARILGVTNFQKAGLQLLPISVPAQNSQAHRSEII